MCPNNSYLRSRAREQQIVRELRAEGWIAARSAGSKSEYDVYAYHPVWNRTKLIQVKTKKGSRKLVKTRVFLHEHCVTEALWYNYG